ncbi:NAD-dependent epimerase/dehydratase family protein [Terrabacter sp. NPDC000476]|uniref:NAD-dependent epimerase/dehydratase family protein n=1 Tax=Terrabacter sp. NPDC000476 TaxID=3154258 RepID=UPI0033262860
MTVLVTGGAGFIGSHVVEALVADGRHVRVLDSLRADVHGTDPDLAVLEALGDAVDLHVGDVTERHDVEAALDGCDVVVHLAAKVGLGVDFDDTEDYARSNVMGTAVLLAATARGAVRRLVLASSMVVYGDGDYLDAQGRVVRPLPRRPADLRAGRFDPVGPGGEALVPTLVGEESVLAPQNVYAATKLHQEHLARAWARSTTGRAALLRFHNVYGPRMPVDTPYAGVASIFRSALERGEAPRVFEDGRQRRDLVHVRDVADAVVRAAGWTTTAEAGSARAFNVGSGVVRTVGELAAELSDALGGPAPEVTGAFRLGDVRHVTASSARIGAELGWRARIAFDDGIEELAAAPLRRAVRP